MPPSNLVIQGLWVGNQLSTLEALSIASFIAHGHQFHLYTYSECSGIPKGTIIKDANEIVEESNITRFKSLANFSDYFRYSVLYKKGGWWSDVDSVCIAPFDFPEEYVFSSEMSNYKNKTGYINCGNIKAPVGAPIMKWCLEQIESKDLKNISWSEIGPSLTKAAVEKFKFQKYVQLGDVFCPIRWQDTPSFIIDPLKSLSFDSTVKAIHFYNETWSRAKQDKNVKYLPTCLYEKLKRQYLIPKRDELPATPKVSIIIPCYNQGNYLMDCVESCLAQSYSNTEIIVVNDGSTDNTLEVAGKYGNTIKVVNQTNKGLSGARNAGLMNSTGELILPLDADDWIHPDYLKLAVPLMTGGIAVVAPHINYVGEWTSDWQSTPPTMAGLLEHNCIAVCSLIRKSALLEVGGWNPKFVWGMEDWNMWIEIFSRGWEFIILPQKVFNYRTHKKSMIHSAEAHRGECLALIRSLHPELYKWKVPPPQAPPSPPPPTMPVEVVAPPIKWEKGFLDKKIQTLFQKFRYVVATVPNSSHYKQLCRIYPIHLEELVDTPEGNRIIFVVEK